MISNRCLALAAKVQILRNRGYALSGDEDDLKSRLQALERDVQDPAVSAREEELWSRLIVLRGYSEKLSKELEKPAGAEGEGLDEETQARAKRVSLAFRRCTLAFWWLLTQRFLGTGRLREAAWTPEKGA